MLMMRRSVAWLVYLQSRYSSVCSTVVGNFFVDWSVLGGSLWVQNDVLRQSSMHGCPLAAREGKLG